MAGGKRDNETEFFITLAAAPELYKQNTLFGKVVGDTIYNLMKMNDYETDKSTDR